MTNQPTSPSQSTSTSALDAEALDRLVLERFPFQIAYGYARTIRPENWASAIQHMIFTYDAVLRFASLVLLAEFLRSPLQEPRIARAVRRLQVPHLNDWFTVLTTLAKYLWPKRGRPGEPALPPFSDDGPLSPALLIAARGLSALRSNGEPAHEAFLRFRNREYGHGTPATEEDRRAQIERPLEILRQVLRLFSPFGDLALIRRSPGGFVRLAGPEPSFAEEPIDDVEVEDLLEESGIAVLGPDGAGLPLYPLFAALPAGPDGLREPLVVADGHSKTAMAYLGVRPGSRLEDREALVRYHDLLSAKNIDPRFTKEDLRPWAVTEWARETTRAVLDSLRGKKYFPDFYQERRSRHGHAESPRDLRNSSFGRSASLREDETVPGVDDQVRSWLDRRREAALLVSAEAGCGKTSLLCRLADTLTEKGKTDCVLLLLGSDVRGDPTRGLFARIRDGLGFVEDARTGVSGFVELLDAWARVGQAEDIDHEQRRLFLLVDAVNEAESPKALLEEIDGLAAIAGDANRRAGRSMVKLLVSIRAERIERIFDRWCEQHDTPFLAHPENFAHFRDREDRSQPYLHLRRFEAQEAKAAYVACQQTMTPSCPAEWDSLASKTQTLFDHPLMVPLFHQAFAGTPHPPAALAEDSVWAAWLERTFDRTGGGARLEQFALDVADVCIDRGLTGVSLQTVTEWRAKWRAELGHDAVRIAAALDPLERLAEAGILRPREDGGLDWASDSLAAQLFFRALRRRRPVIDEAAVREWMALAATAHMHGALVHAGVAAWTAGEIGPVAAMLDAERKRAARLASTVLERVAPLGAPDEVADALPPFEAMLRQLEARAWSDAGSDGSLDRARALQATLEASAESLSSRMGAASALRGMLGVYLRLNERLVALEPENTDFLRGLSVSFNRMGNLDERTDPENARAWFQKDLDINQRLVALEPENTHFLRGLSVSFRRMGDLDERTAPENARAWFQRALDITQRLAVREPEDTGFLWDLSTLSDRMGDLDGRRDPKEARMWAQKALEIVQRLVALQPENIDFLRDLSVLFNRMGDLDRRTDPEKARMWAQKALDIDQRLVALEPENRDFLRGLSVSLDRMGDLDERTDREKARAWFQRALEIYQRLVALEPENTDFLSGLSVSFNRMGNLDERTDPENARAWFQKDLDINQRLVALEPENTHFLRGLSVSFRRMGDLDERTDPEKARAWFQKDLGINQRLVALEPENRDFLRGLAVSLERTSDLDSGTAPEKARVWIERALDIWQNLVAREPENLDFLRGLSAALQRMGDLHRHTDPAKTRVWIERALDIRQSLVILDPENREFLRDLSLSLAQMGDLDRGRAPERARPWIQRALDIFQRLVALEPENLNFLRNLSAALQRMGDLDRRTDPEKARAWFRQDLEMGERRLAIEPENTHLLWGIALALARLASMGEDAARCSDRTIEALARAAAIRPEDLDAHYNRACVYALLGNPGEALAALARAVELGWSDSATALEDPDLESLLALPEFHALLARMAEAVHNRPG